MRSSEPIRPSSRRGASGAWNRLKPVREDVLETYGLPSKGETRLNDFKTQETYLNRIIERYMKVCALNREELDALFASVGSRAVGQDLSAQFSALDIDVKKNNTLAASKHAPPLSSPSPSPPIKDLETVLMALRKLREAITSSARVDTFARRAYTFNIHVAILCAHHESYVPALHTLLYTLHPASPLPAPALKDFLGLHILDIACRQSDYRLAREVSARFAYTDRRVDGVVRALVADDWVGFWRLRAAVDGYQRSLMGWAEGRVRGHALRAIGRAYVRVERGWLERMCAREWGELVREEGVGWECREEGGREVVVVQKVKRRGGEVV